MNWPKWFGAKDDNPELKALQAEARDIDVIIAKHRDRKKEIGDLIVQIEQARLAALPPNPKGTMTIGM